MNPGVVQLPHGPFSSPATDGHVDLLVSSAILLGFLDGTVGHVEGVEQDARLPKCETMPCLPPPNSDEGDPARQLDADFLADWVVVDQEEPGLSLRGRVVAPDVTQLVFQG